MLSGGSVNSHGNYYKFGDNSNWNAMTTYSVAAFLQRKNGTWSAGNGAFGKYNTGTTKGWIVYANTATNKLCMFHGDGTGTAAADQTTAFTLDTTQSFIVSWSGTQVSYFLNNVADGVQAQTRAISTDTIDLNLLQYSNAGSDGLAAYIGHMCMWKNYQLLSAERATYHAGTEMPSLTNLKIWVRGVVEPALETVQGIIGTEVGSVTAVSDPVDAYFGSGSSFAFLIADVLMPLFLPTLLAAGFGAALKYENMDKVKQLLGARCIFDWTNKELKDFLRAAGSRRKIIDLGAFRLNSSSNLFVPAFSEVV